MLLTSDTNAMRVRFAADAADQPAVAILACCKEIMTGYPTANGVWGAPPPPSPPPFCSYPVGLAPSN